MRKRSLKSDHVVSGSESDDTEDPETETEAATVPKKEPTSMKKVVTRTVVGVSMCLAYIAMLQAGHFYCILVGVLTQIELFRELVSVRYDVARERYIPFFRTLQWLWFSVAIFFCYGETVQRFVEENPNVEHFSLITNHIGNISFGLYCSVFVLTVLTLKKGMIRYQLGELMWTIVIICMVVLQCKYFASHSLQGLFWYIFPMATVVMNDTSAFFCGITMGRKFISAPFLALSPNKTWEGFLGAGVLTIIFGFFFPVILAQYSWLTCPTNDLYILQIPPPPLQCTPNAVFLPADFSVPFPVILSNIFHSICPSLFPLTLQHSLTSITHITVSLLPIQIHGLFYGLFAATVAPFGGFLASAIKRAYHKKDFDAFLPGHGGLMDRMDCILLMIFFSSIYYRALIESHIPTLNSMLSSVAMMKADDQALLYEKLGTMLAAK